METSDEFMLAVITSPGRIRGEGEFLAGLLTAGLGRLHLRKPGGSVDALLELLAPRWASKLVVHGSVGLARRYGVSQVHGPVDDETTWAEDNDRMKRSTSVHSWRELARLPRGLEYAFISPVFDSISKPGYRATEGLLAMPSGPLPCRPVGMGGISAETIGLMTNRGWKGAAALGWIWEEPAESVSRFEQLKKIIDG